MSINDLWMRRKPHFEHCGVVSLDSTLYLARLSDLEDLAVGRSRQKVIKTHEYYPTVGYGIMTSGRIIGGDYFNLHTRAHEGPMMYGRILPMFFGTVRFLPNDHGYYLTEFRSDVSSTHNTYHATVEPGLTLDLGSVPCEGYATMSPAKKYFGVPGKKLIESWPIPALPEVVQITAHGLCGFAFIGWNGDGSCWPYEPCEDELLFEPPLPIDETNAAHEQVWIAMDHTKQITPQFQQCIHCGYATPSQAPPGSGTDVGRLRGDQRIESDVGFQNVATNSTNACRWFMGEKLTSIGQSWNSHLQTTGDPDRPFQVVSLSVPGGGPRSVGRSHQNGLDVDVRYVRNRGTGPLDLARDVGSYDREATQTLVELFCNAGATLVIIDDQGLSEINPSCRAINLPNHTNHFHVRFEDPDGAPPDCPVCPNMPYCN